ncbi:MAG TPA: peptidoglycan DD-metalloendopeptidase family protein [Xanthobacteraceae bacterium]|jgi:septal ring factor EnvC (AmiA/AmiB activator)
MSAIDCHSVRPRTLFAAVPALALALSLAPALAQAPTLDQVRQHDQELEAIRAQQKAAIENEKALRDQINTIGEDRRKLSQSLIDSAAGIRAVEDRVAAAERRVQQYVDSESQIRRSLDGRRAVIVEVLAALQRIGRRPPPALMVKPEDALESVRTAMLLGAVVPDLRLEAEQLAGDLNDLVRVRAEAAAERDGLARDLAALSAEQNRMTLLVDERQKRQAEAEKAFETERQRAADLARQADGLKDLIARLERGLDPASRAARNAESRTPGDARQDLAVLSDPGRLAPAIAFASAKGMLPIPVNGVRARDFGSPDGNGGTERGISVATRAGAQVTAPCDGWVVYAAPYRSYGKLLILNAGGGYHVVLAGMERISVDIGQFVLTGEPVGVMGSGPQVASAMVASTAGSGQPVLYIEFRKDGSPVDPNPWWATPDSEKVRG